MAGRRVSKCVAGVTTYYLYDGDSVIAEVDSSGKVVAGYTWGAQSQFYQYDARGCAAAVPDAGTGWLDSVTTVLNSCQTR